MKKTSELEAHADLIKEKFKQSCAELGIAVSHFHLTISSYVVCISYCIIINT